MRGVMDSSGYFKALEAKQAASLAPSAGKQVASNDKNGFFGEDGANFRDVLDAVNPLNHIPIVSDMLEGETGHKVSSASKILGGALIGGPIGLFAAVADAVFEAATGKSAVGTMVAALTGDETPTETATMVASNETDPNAPLALAANDALSAPVDPVEVADQAKVAVKGAKEKLAGLAPVPIQVADIADNQAARDQAVLALYGNSPNSAHRSYKQAQMLPYLRDVTTTHVL